MCQQKSDIDPIENRLCGRGCEIFCQTKTRFIIISTADKNFSTKREVFFTISWKNHYGHKSGAITMA